MPPSGDAADNADELLPGDPVGTTGGYAEDHGRAPEELRASVETLLGEDWAPLPDAEAIARLGHLIDAAHDTNHADAVRVAITRGEALLARPLAPADRAAVHYFLANAWSAARCAAGGHNGVDAWDVPEPAQEIVHLRRALRFGAPTGVDAPAREARVRYCQTATNLGNLMNECGRIVDAVAYWDAALVVDPEFTMALGNRGVGLAQYAQVVHDPGHQVWFLRAANAALVRATDPEHAWRAHPGARAYFAKTLATLRTHVPASVLEHPPPTYRFPQRMPRRERAYREWCLHRRLFLNDLNDLGADELAAADVLVLPNLGTPFGAGPPNAIDFFNQLKQEYVSARYLYYEGVTRDAPHFSDREVTLLNTLDYPSYGLAVEQVKAAFRIAYSLFDKIAFFVNDYLSLGIVERDVSFRKLWYERQQPDRGLRADVHRLDNGLLKGLFWLAKDLYERDPRYVDALEPYARETDLVRNHLEHKYLKLHTFGPPEPPAPGEVRVAGEALAYSLDRGEFERRTLGLLQTARSALIQLTLAVYVEEHRRRRDAGDVRLVVDVPTEVWEDRWKV